ncbi:MAG: VTT domain-containing protein [Polyangiaceae bacterium]
MSRRGWIKIGLVLAVAGMLVAAWRLGLFGVFSDAQKVKQALLELGGWGYVAFVGAYTALQPFGVPGSVFVFAAPLIWPWPIAFALSMTGTMTASVVGFSFARFIARDWLAKRVPARFRRYDDALARRAFLTVVTLRFLLWMPQALHTFFGVSKVPFWTHFWGSLVGYAVPLFLVSLFGEQLWEWMKGLPAWAWVVMGIGTAFAIAAYVIVERRRARAATAVTVPAHSRE